MPRLVWSTQARQDLGRLKSFLESKDRELALRAIRAVRDGVKILEHYPETGRLIEGLPAPI